MPLRQSGPKNRIRARAAAARLAALGICLLFSTSALAATEKNAQAVLSPDRFTMPMKLGYVAAKQYPELIDQIFCFCGCDKHDGHNSLLDCYKSTHGSYCGICLEESIKAKELKLQGLPINRIKAQIDYEFGKLYPLPEPTEKLIKWRSSIGGMIYQPVKKSTPSGNKSKPRQTKGSPGSCCADHPKR